MNAKDELINLIAEALDAPREKITEGQYKGCYLSTSEHIANYLISKGITISKKVKPKHEHLNYYCPNCGTWLLWDDAIPNETDNFCSKCGKAIDWSEVE